MARHYATIILLSRNVPICKKMSTPDNIPNMQKVSQTLTMERHDSLFNSRDHCRGMIALSTAEDMSLKGSLMGKISGSQDCMPNDKKIEGGLQGLHCINPIALGNASIVPNDTQKQ